jgi:hypothetical protein
MKYSIPKKAISGLLVALLIAIFAQEVALAQYIPPNRGAGLPYPTGRSGTSGTR